MDGVGSPDISELRGEVNIRKISKLEDSRGRDEVAAKVVQQRKSRDEIRAKEVRLDQIEEEKKRTEESESEKLQQMIELLTSPIERLKNMVGLGEAAGLNREARGAGLKRGELWEESFRMERELEEQRNKQKGLPSPKEIIQSYYENLQLKPLTNEQKRSLLSVDVVSKLSNQEYLILWRRLNPHFLTHVTRQGFRDHNAMVYHSGGMHEFQQGFVGILEDEKMLRPPIVLDGLKDRGEESVKVLLKDWVLQAGSEAEAKQRLHNLLNFSLASAPNYPDKTAVHFAAQLVANDYYGGESGNEVFFVFPSDVLASQFNFAFNGWEKDFTRPQSETKWNDVFVWPESLDNPGIPIDAGITFLPGSIYVDVETGSKYAYQEIEVDGVRHRALVEDGELVKSYVDWAKSLGDQSPVVEAMRRYQQEENYYRQENMRGGVISLIMKEFVKLGFRDDAAAPLAIHFFREFVPKRESEPLSDNDLDTIIKSAGANWKRSDNVIPAKQYWEKYFSERPDLRPKHIYYYDGDPSVAVYKFEQDNKIGLANTSDSDGRLLGFDDHHVLDVKHDGRSNMGYTELVDLATKIIEDHYKLKK